MRTILVEEIRSTQMNISPEELEKLAKRMEKNKDVMCEINMMVK